MTGVWTPQWLYQHVTLPASATIRIEPSAFKNDTPWPMFLKWLSLAGNVVQDDAGEFANTYGGIARRLRFELSLTQKGDINYTMANTQTLFCGHQMPLDYFNRYDFNPMFPLGPDEGLNVEVTNIHASLAWDFPAFTAYGLREENKFRGRMVPAMLAGQANLALAVNQSVTLPTVDLYNNGDSTLWLRYMGMGNLMNKLALVINPNSGLPWMPQFQPIPVPNFFGMTISGDSSGLTSSTGNAVYVLPQRSLLKPRQRLGVEVTNLSAKEQKFGLCLHGLLEVQ